ncbi:MAG: cadherin-like domain-containing protein, partial [Burkholderiales bacterium]|nr:cadherin-like domain-containing protein [Burkholderiales bacterium]
GADKTVTTAEDTAYTFSASDFGFADIDSGDSLSAVRIDTLPSAGSLTLSGVAVTGAQVISAANLGNLLFTPAGDANGAGYATFTFSVRDQSSAFDTAPNTITFNVTAVNDAPTGADKTVTTAEDTTYTFSASDFGFADIDSGDSLSAVRIDTLPGAGSLTLSGVAVTGAQVISAANLGNLLFTPAGDANGAGYATLTFSVRDQSSAFDTTPNTITFDVTAVNDAPAGSDRTVTVTEDTTYVFTPADFGFADGDGHALAAVWFDTLPVSGTLRFDGIAFAAGNFVVAADIAAGRLTYVPAADDSGAGAAAFTYSVQDNGGTAGGGVDRDPTPNTLSIDITAVNDAPTLTGGAGVALAGTDEDSASAGTTVASLLAAAATADVDTGAFTGIAVTATTGNGTWQYTIGGAIWTDFGSVSTSNALLLAAASTVRYLPDAANAESAGFSFKAWDQTAGSASLDGARGHADAAAGGGAAAFSAGTAGATIAVTAVNDAPVIAAGTPIALGATDALTPGAAASAAALLDAATWSDADLGALRGIAVTETSGSGTWQYSNDALVWAAVGPVTADAALLLDAGALVRYVPAGGAGTASLTFAAWDRSAGSASSVAVPVHAAAIGGGSQAWSLATAVARITVAPVAAAPTDAAADAGPAPPAVVPPAAAPAPVPAAAVPPVAAPPAAASAPAAASPGTPGTAAAATALSPVAEAALALEQAIVTSVVPTAPAPIVAPPIQLAAADSADLLRPGPVLAAEAEEWDVAGLDYRWDALLRATTSAASSGWAPAGAVLSVDTVADAAEEAAEDRGRPLLSIENGVKFSGVVATAGFVAWALRGAGIMTSLLVSMPAWRHLDPIPVLAASEARPDWARGNDDSDADATPADGDDALHDLLHRPPAPSHPASPP